MAKKEIIEKVTVADLKKKSSELKSDKDNLAKQKANELLNGLSLPDSVKKSLNLESKPDPDIKTDGLLVFDDSVKSNDALDESKKSKSDEWLQDELSRLTEELDKTRNELKKSKEDYEKLFNTFKIGGNQIIPSNNASSDEYKQKLKIIFNEFEANFLGTNPQRQRFSDVKIQHVLNKLVENFSFLVEGR